MIITQHWRTRSAQDAYSGVRGIGQELDMLENLIEMLVVNSGRLSVIA